MANKRHTTEEIVHKLRQIDVLVGLGMARVDADLMVYGLDYAQRGG
jgi:hypothetical protein